MALESTLTGSSETRTDGRAAAVAPALSIVIPTLNEADEIAATLDAAEAAIARGALACEILAVDGGSRDATPGALRARATARLLDSEPGRARQMNAGARAALGDWLFFLHADTHLDPAAMAAIEPAIQRGPERAWAFELRFRSPGPVYRRLERGVAWRCRRFGLAYGDQGLLIHRGLFDRIGGFRPAAAMEDLDLALRLRRERKIGLLDCPIHTSARRYEAAGPRRRAARNLACMTAGILKHYVMG